MSYPSDLSKLSTLSWDTRTVPWIDGKGKLDHYILWFKSGKHFTKRFLKPITTKSPRTCAVSCCILLSYGLAKDLCKNFPFDVIESEHGANRICKAIHERGILSGISNTNHDLFPLLPTMRGQTENYRYYEVLFAAAIVKFNSSTHPSLPEFLTAFMLLFNSSIDSNQHN